MSLRTCAWTWHFHAWKRVGERQRCRRCTKYNPRGVSAEVRFWDAVSKEGHDGCWLWFGAKSRDGYGICHLNDDLGFQGTQQAHRAAWYLMSGTWPDPKLTVDHLRRNRNCVNPYHMEETTIAVNLSRRPDFGVCRKGHRIEGANERKFNDGKRRCRTCYESKLKHLITT